MEVMRTSSVQVIHLHHLVLPSLFLQAGSVTDSISIRSSAVRLQQSYELRYL